MSASCFRDVRDRGILKIHEPMPALSNDSPCSSPNIDIRLKALQQGYESDSSACSAPPGVGMNSPRYHGPNKMAARPEVKFADEFNGINGKEDLIKLIICHLIRLLDDFVVYLLSFTVLRLSWCYQLCS